MAKTAWGIELGTSSIKAVRLSEDRGSVTIDAISIISLNDYGLGSGTSAADATAAALSAFRVTNGVKSGETIYVSIKGQNTLGRIISLPPVSDEKVRQTIENEAKSQVPIPLEQAVWDYQTIDDPGSIDERKVNLYAAKKQAVEEIVDACETAGLEITGIQVAPLGIYNFIKFELDEGISSCCVAIDIGAENTDLVVIDGQKTYVRVVPVAGNDITKALKARFKLSDDDAEKLKRRAAKSKDAAAVFEAMKPPLKEMVGEIYRAVGFYKSQNEAANINQLVMMGNGSKLINIQKFFEQQLQYKVHKVESPQRLQLSRSVDPAEVQDNIQSLTVAIGLGLEGLALPGLNTINLMPRERLEAREKKKLVVPMISAGAMMFVGGLAAMIIGISSSGGVDEKVSAAEKATAQSAEASGKVTAAGDNAANENKALSFRNLSMGRVGSVEINVPEKEGEPAHKKTVHLELPARIIPLLISRATDEALVQFAIDNPQYQYYRINKLAESAGEVSLVIKPSTLQNNWVPAADAPADDPDAAGGYFTAKREFKYEASLGGLVYGQGATPPTEQRLREPYDTAEQALAGSSEGNGGTITAKVKAALIAELKARGQLAGLSEADIGNIKWIGLTVRSYYDNAAIEADKGIPIVTYLGNNLPGAKANNPKRYFSPFRVQVTLALGTIDPPAAEAAAATEGK
jgi:type IV pilus assembly protein PilM